MLEILVLQAVIVLTLNTVLLLVVVKIENATPTTTVLLQAQESGFATFKTSNVSTEDVVQMLTVAQDMSVSKMNAC